jgi:serine/threonine-protein kinase
MSACPACAHDTPEGSRYCPHCSKSLDATSAQTEIMGVGVSTALSTTSSVDEGRFLPGTVVGGRYRIAGLLGRGGMGEVYRATDLTLGQAVALKFLPEATSNDERALARFYNEVRVARQVTHPNVCRVYDVGIVQNLHYISMEFVDGEDLGVLLRRIGRLPVDKAVETARKICAGLAAAHEKGVLHRDLKPANVMIDGRGQVVIMDFGLAGLAGQLQGDVRSGTPAYMSPEQLAGTEVTVKSDIYALGLLLYEIFTGRQAFQASSLIELMQMQERAAPASITTVVKELDPVVERVIMRCLHHDPRQRPASALAVAAGMPGGDPLAAALAAGETPSPELVAAAGETEGLAPRTAMLWLGAAVAALGVAVALCPRVSVTSRLNVEASPEALTRDARSMIRGFGYTAKPFDSAWSLQYDDDYKNYAKAHSAETAMRWQNPAAGQPPIVQFWYRESPRALMALRRSNVFTGYDDPPLEVSGMIRLKTDPDGKLIQFEAVPPQVEAPAPLASPFDWNRLFQAAGLNLAAFQSAEPEWTPLANWDTRGAWKGVDTATHVPLRVEAAAWRGRPVFFRIIGPWTHPERAAGASGGGAQIPVLILVYISLIASLTLGWINYRAGRLDHRGANRLFLIYALSQVVVPLIAAHHAANQAELALFWMSVANAALNGAIVWVFYAALEPWVRRYWPQTVISWSRYVSKGWRDPLVGRDLLFGVALGITLPVINGISVLLHGNDGQPLFPPLHPLLGARMEMAQLLGMPASSIFEALLFFLVLFLLRVLLRKEWIAILVFIALITLVTTRTTTPAIDYPAQLLSIAILGFVLLHMGLLASIIVATVEQLASLGGSLDFSAWWAGMAAVPFLVILAIAVYGFRTSLGGRPLFKIAD